MRAPTGELMNLEPREFSFAAHPEITKSGFYRYDVILPLEYTNSVPLRSVTLTLWSKEQFEEVKNRENLITIMKDEGNLPIMLCSGLAANSTQYDRTDVSFIKSLDENIQNNLHKKVKGKKSLFIAMSCPGFTGSDDINPKNKITRETVSVDTYSNLIQEVITELQIPTRSILAGHSAGGAAVLHLLSEQGDARAHIALHPAIHKKRALQFDIMRTLEKVKPILVDDKFKRDITEVVIRFYLGLPNLKGLPKNDLIAAAKFITELKEFQDLFKTISPAELEQVYLHVDEFMKHRDAGIAKLDDLHTARKHYANTAAATSFVITGSKDKITRNQDINEEFSFILGQRATKELMDTDHDDIFIKPDAQNMATNLIAQNALYDLGLLDENVRKIIRLNRERAETRRKQQIAVIVDRRRRGN
jgi:pimeloyl-ACP methyl ester carboxylesterase